MTNVISRGHIISIGLAVFSMFFGAGNLMYPLVVGQTSGTATPVGIIAFLITAVWLPVLGLIAMILFDGNYRAFFHRLGTTAGESAILISMLIIGPIIAIPRIVTLSHIMTAPFLPNFLATITPTSSFVFALLFLGITFLATFRESRIVDLLGNVISPALLISLIIIIVRGALSATTPIVVTESWSTIFIANFMRGYETLDLLGAIFFSSIVLQLVKAALGKTGYSHKLLVSIGLKTGFIGVGLLALVYIGMSFLGMYHAHGFEVFNAGQLFSAISLRVLGEYGAAVISVAVFMACLSTAIALAAVTAQYIQVTLCNNTISFVTALCISLFTAFPLSSGILNCLIPSASGFCGDAFGFILSLTAGPIVYIGYPMLITLTACNVAYKLWGFTPIRLPVALTGIFAVAVYCMYSA